MGADQVRDTHVDVLIVGAGISGIGMACHLAMACPGKTVALLERRKAIGGTWDLFRYPGVRSDSDMFSFGYQFRPWHELKVLADGPSIRSYVEDTARAYGVDRKIHFGVRITDARWSSIVNDWTVTAVDEDSALTHRYSCHFLVSCTGYFDHERGYLPDYPGLERYQGQFIHPQHWPDDLDYRGKRVVVIGSGATAVTLVPALAGETAHITMLQRSPSYILSLPSHDKISAALRHVLPARLVYGMARKRNIALQRLIFKAAKRWPDRVRSVLLWAARRKLGSEVALSHFSPAYRPWEQRLCAVPDGDLFLAIRDGKASIVTDTIDTFTEHGIQLASGEQLDADIVISATGFQLLALGGMELSVDGEPRALNDLLTYKGVLLQDTPNLAVIFGYTNASWTLKVDLAASYVCRLLNYMDNHRLSAITPRAPAGERGDETILASLSSGYVQRGNARMPRQGRHLPWRVTHNYEQDRRMLLRQPIEDPALECVMQAEGSATPHAGKELRNAG
ncbi:flavin-containing monooxygenase [Dyella soli]|uniref:NAD(P)/FAD-dependent oxidoreductase n=1 Tax=Dyella soli TaxID=522319 RepID=A0A4R0YS28_9GAMM|nr:NAD(P)/FAD-dependent oxidoreductase [Dyella soli]TCI09603.1 NAD(P)/FAD-dependent oxidoreductase [Dyella soli]